MYLTEPSVKVSPDNQDNVKQIYTQNETKIKPEINNEGKEMPQQILSLHTPESTRGFSSKNHNTA